MSLEKWAEYGWLKAEPTSRDEISGLFQIVDRDLKDSGIEGISEDRRFEAAFNAARTVANIALRASGYRTSAQMGHHLKTVESLEFTIKSDDRLIQKMKLFSKKRNTTSYDTAGNVTKHELEQVIAVANELKDSVIVWLQKTNPKLI